jgi:hypothetical protein
MRLRHTRQHRAHTRREGLCTGKTAGHNGEERVVLPPRIHVLPFPAHRVRKRRACSKNAEKKERSLGFSRQTKQYGVVKAVMKAVDVLSDDLLQFHGLVALVCIVPLGCAARKQVAHIGKEAVVKGRGLTALQMRIATPAR